MQSQPRPERIVHFIIKISKLCNLRCKYCYEMPELANRDAMSLDQLDRMYLHIAEHYGALEEPTRLVMVWHGGEPLLQQPDFYWRTFERQQKIFQGFSRLRVENVVQTNLTVLDEERLRLLRDGFSAVGVSIDLFGGLRVNLAGRDAEERVLQNMDRLNEAGIPYGGITVLTRLNRPHVKRIYRFYESMSLPFRLLPIFPGAFEDQHAGFGIDAAEVLAAFREVVDLWLESDKYIAVIPIDGHIREVLLHLTEGAPTTFYDRRRWETAVMVNTSGDVFGYPEAYDPAYCYGNVFTTPLGQLFASPNREKSLKAAETRMALSCIKCPYFGACSGYHMAEDNRRYDDAVRDGNALCVVEKNLLAHIERRLKESGLSSANAGDTTDRLALDALTRPAHDNQALAFPA